MGKLRSKSRLLNCSKRTTPFLSTRRTPKLESLQTRRARRTTRSKMPAETEFSSRSKMLKTRKARVLEEVSDIGKEKARVQGGLSVSIVKKKKARMLRCSRRKQPRLKSVLRSSRRKKLRSKSRLLNCSKRTTPFLSTRRTPKLESLQTRRARRTTRSKMSAETEFSSRSKMLKTRKARVLEEVSDIGKKKARVQGGLSVS